MHTRALPITLVCLVFMLVTAVECHAEDAEVLSRQEILTLLPRGIDMDDANDIERYNKLVAQGPAVHEVLGEELIRVDDWITASRIIAVFLDSSGDKSVALKYIKGFLEVPRNNDDMWPSVRSQALGAVDKLQQSQESGLRTHTDQSREMSTKTPNTTKLLKDSNSPTTRVVATSSLPWSIIVVMSIAAFGLLLLLFKSRE